MRILVLSDTHIPASADELPKEIKIEAKKSDYCLHAGDFIEGKVFKLLSKWIKTYGVSGNMDRQELQKELPETQIIKLDNLTFALAHGKGDPASVVDYITRLFAADGNSIDIYIFGHSHIAFNEEIDGKIYFNPGSPTDKVFAPFRSYGILEISNSAFKRRIVKIG
ncbi:MAG: metallophosphoesterase [Candidatus Omnitrophota bacterium]